MGQKDNIQHPATICFALYNNKYSSVRPTVLVSKIQSVPFSVFVISDNNILLPFFPTISVLSFRCRIFSLPNFPLPIFLVAVFPLPFFPLPLFHTLILCCPVFLPYHFSLPIFPIAQFFGCRFFRCRFSVAIFPLPFLPFTDATAAGSL